MLRDTETEEPFNPSILPRGLGKRQPISQTCGKLLRFLHQIRAIRMEITQPSLQVGHASRGDAIAVFPCMQLSNLQLHPQNLSFHFFVRSTDIASAAVWRIAIVDPALLNKPIAISSVTH